MTLGFQRFGKKRRNPADTPARSIDERAEADHKGDFNSFGIYWQCIPNNNFASYPPTSGETPMMRLTCAPLPGTEQWALQHLLATLKLPEAPLLR